MCVYLAARDGRFDNRVRMGLGIGCFIFRASVASCSAGWWRVRFRWRGSGCCVVVAVWAVGLCMEGTTIGLGVLEGGGA